MKIYFLNYLAVMVRSGISFDDAILILNSSYSKFKVINALVIQYQSGANVSAILCRFFPWWCPYPYSQDFHPPNTGLFLTSANDYLNERQQFLTMIFKLLYYPLCLFFFALFIYFFSVQTIQVTAVGSNQFNLIVGSILFVYIIFFMFYIRFVFTIIRFGIYDVLVLLQYSLLQGISLDTLLNAFLFPTPYQHRWARLSELMIDKQSFADAFCYLFNLPNSIQSVMRSHEIAGNLAHAFKLIIPLYKSMLLKRLITVSHFFKCGIYFFILILILIIVQLIYTPMFNL